MYHSQEGQDKFLEEQVFKGFACGCFVDVGAHDGVTLNNTLFFEKQRHWRGLNIEPNPTVFEQLVANRPDAINACYAIAEKEGEADFYLHEGYSEMLSGLAQSYDPRHTERARREQTIKGGRTQVVKVQTIPLKVLFEAYDISRVHYLSIDVEGGEKQVIQSIDFNKVFIDVIGFEANYEDQALPLIADLESKGYKVIHRGVDIIMLHNDSQFRFNLGSN